MMDEQGHLRWPTWQEILASIGLLVTLLWLMQGMPGLLH